MGYQKELPHRTTQNRKGKNPQSPQKIRTGNQTQTPPFPMKKITAKDFYQMISEKPSVFEHWDTPLEITEYVNCEDSRLTHLSKHLTFSGKNKFGNSADFSDCKNLEIATGTFHGFVSFAASGIQKIENLQTGVNKQGNSVSFGNCKSLKVATGTYPGFASFYGSGIHSIQNLEIQNPDKEKYFAHFKGCSQLHTLQGWDLSKKIKIEPEKREAEINRRASLKKFLVTITPKELPFL
jgi:hypothetical protein